MIFTGKLEGGAIKSLDYIAPEDMQLARALGAETPADAAKLYTAVDWMFRCVTLISSSMGAIPVTIRATGAEDALWDSSEDSAMPPQLKLFENIPDLLWLTAAAYPLLGRAYMLRGRNMRRQDVGMRWLMASSMEPIIDVSGLQGFYRTAQNGVRFKLPVDDVLYMWWRDPLVEMGEPVAYPGRAAALSAGVLDSMDQFLSRYFARGMMKATLLVTKGVAPVQTAERDRIRDWWRRMTSGGVKTAFTTEVINGDAVEVVQIGDGLTELGNAELTAEKREAISTAFGVPHSLVMSNASNFATAQQDVLSLYQNTVIPQAKQIAYEMNRQLFNPLGYELRFEYSRIEAMQRSEVEKAQAVSQLVGTGKAILTVNEARELLGYEPIEGGDELAGQGPTPLEVAAMARQANPQPQPEPGQPDAADTRKDEEVKRLKAFIANGKYLERPFKSDILTPGEIQEAIRSHEWASYP